MEMRESSKMADGDNNGFVNIPLAAKDVLASIYMREIGDREYRVSFRSKGSINVAKVAEQFGGGGHNNAAGCRIVGDWDESELQLVEAMVAAVADSNSDSDEPEPITGFVGTEQVNEVRPQAD